MYNTVLPEYSNYMDADIFLSERTLPGNSLEKATTRLVDIANDLKEQTAKVDREYGWGEYNEKKKLEHEQIRNDQYPTERIKPPKLDPVLLEKRNRLVGRLNAISGVLFNLRNRTPTHHIINRLLQGEDFFNDYDLDDPFDKSRLGGVHECLSILKHVHALDMVSKQRVGVATDIERSGRMAFVVDGRPPERGVACPAVEIGDSLQFKGRHTGKVYRMVVEALYPTAHDDEYSHCAETRRLRMVFCDDGVWRYPYDSISVNCNKCPLTGGKWADQ